MAITEVSGTAAQKYKLGRKRGWAKLQMMWWATVSLSAIPAAVGGYELFHAPWGALLGTPFLVYGIHKYLEASHFFADKFGDAMGTAKWGTLDDLRKQGMLTGNATSIKCGEMNGRPVYYNGDIHLLTVGITGTGKDMRFIAPNLVHLAGRSVVVLDVAGEEAAMTACVREKDGPVIIINPCGVLVDKLPHLKSVGYNPLIHLDVNDPLFYDKASEIGESIIDPDTVDEEHWINGCVSMVSACLMRAKFEEDANDTRASLGLVNEMLSRPYSEDGGGLTDIFREISKHPFKPMARLVERFLKWTREHNSFVSVALNNMKCLNSPAVAEDLERHPIVPSGKFRGMPFDFRMLKEEVMTVYIILDDGMLTTHRTWLRLIVASALNALKHSGPGPIRPLLMLNEIGNVGRLDSLKAAMTMARKKGITVWSFWQSLAQISEIYGKGGAATFKSGAGVISSLRVNDPETAEELSKRSGSQTAIKSSYSAKQGTDPARTDTSASAPLIRPEYFTSLAEGEVVAYFGTSTPYLLHAPINLKGLDPNPYYGG